ncbi:hypothetical protein BOX15_Mlig021960g2 [Macrostomum lignano]|uniref:Uncharacterized protein n=1 Tax=Macrostomum lignano TaxID=282301 RepID=A0A267EHR4_9PLAT|nr:hypothetical protein BOX15_Mlig021960g2 [Macrostomum lignano]
MFSNLLSAFFQSIAVVFMQASLIQQSTDEPTDQEFMTAIAAGNLALIRHCLKKRSMSSFDRLISFHGNQLSPLHLACATENSKVVDQLTSLGFDGNIQDRSNGAAPLHIACQSGRPASVEPLIKAQADVNLTDRHGASPLFIAAQDGHHQIVSLLIRAKADVNLAAKNGMTSLHIASQEGNYQVVELLIQALANVNIRDREGATPLYLASQNDHIKVVRLLIKAGAMLNSQTNKKMSPLHVASQNGHQRIVQALVNAGANVNSQQSDGATPLYFASQKGHYAVALILVKAHADVNLPIHYGAIPLHVALVQGHNDVIKLLIEARSDVDYPMTNGQTPLYISADHGNRQTVQCLINAQADVNCRRRDGATPLCIAAQNGHSAVVQSLIGAQADVDIRGLNEMSPLYLAAQAGRDQVVKLLVDAGAAVNLQQKDGATPMYIASQQGHHRVVELLIRAQADVNLSRIDGATPVCIAAHFGRDKVMELLIEAGANVADAVYDGKTPIQIAAEEGHSRVYAVLKSAMLKMDLSMEEDDTMNNCQDPGAPEDNENRDYDEHELSQQLHQALTRSGFTDSRAAMQSSLADALQSILRLRLNHNEIHVVGSYSEGWGNNLTTLDGRTDFESDIDVMRLLHGRLYHLRSACQCVGKDVETVDYDNGHIACKGFASTPASASDGSHTKPAVDLVDACRLCCYPPIAPLQQDRIAKSNITESVLRSLNRELTLPSSPCHVVHAAPPGQGGEQLRVSTTFLERRLLRSLSTLQGQLFVALKYLVKKVICHDDGFKVKGLKAYHAKTITFQMLEATPADQWKPENLVGLIRQSLQRLLDNLESACNSDSAEGPIMSHFFLCDTALYLKGVDRSSSEKMKLVLTNAATGLRKTIDQLPRLLLKFKANLREVTNSGRFYFHPFLILPNLQANPVSSTAASLEYHEISDVVRESLVQLAEEDCSATAQENLAKLIARLPDCALTARESLKVLACLKFSYRDAAVRTLAYCDRHEVSRGIPWSANRSRAEATAELVMQFMKANDSAWKFCFKFAKRPELRFLSPTLVHCFPQVLENDASWYFVNFDALMQCLRLEITPNDLRAQLWVWDVAKREDADVLELMTAASYCNDKKLIDRFIERIRRISFIPDWLRENLKLKLRDAW